MGFDVTGFSQGFGSVLVAFLAGWGVSFILSMFNQSHAHE